MLSAVQPVHSLSSLHDARAGRLDSSQGVDLHSRPLRTSTSNDTSSSDSNTDSSRRWTEALIRPTEIPSDLIALQRAPKRQLRLHGQKDGTGSLGRSFRRSVVLPSMHSMHSGQLDTSTVGGSANRVSSLPGLHRTASAKQTLSRALSRSQSMPNIQAQMEKAKQTMLKAWEGKDLGELIGNGSIRIVVMGAARCGKSALVTRFVEGLFLEEYYPTTENRSRKTVQLDSSSCTIELVDTSGSIRNRHNHYCEIAHGFLLVFDVERPETFEKVCQIRNTIELQRGPNRSPIVVVGARGDTPSSALGSAGERQARLQGYIKRVREWNCEFVEATATSPRCVTVFYQLARVIRDHYIQVLIDDFETYNPNAPGFNRAVSQPASVKSAPAAIGRRRSHTQTAEAMRRSNSVGQLMQNMAHSISSNLASDTSSRGSESSGEPVYIPANSLRRSFRERPRLAMAAEGEVEAAVPTVVQTSVSEPLPTAHKESKHVHTWMAVSLTKKDKCGHCRKAFGGIFGGSTTGLKCAEPGCGGVCHKKCAA
eukprot:comp21779_c0_seq1/m.30919 comp21779_c0_seq1/g.30919  ORF comp21779_c0_seq1/g.30919 comp21779_c0_seq1/m.30919 type:complete len:538 (-) comp21779_c0_seq1:392-2005(-)